VSPCAKSRDHFRLSCRTSATPQTSTDVARFPSSVLHWSSSERRLTVEVRENARGVCVARWYDPGTGQFISVDPDLAETNQPYAYVGDDPVNRTDPTGLTWGFTSGVCGDASAEIGFGIGGLGAEGQPCGLHTNRSDLKSQDGVSFTVGVTFLNLGIGAAASVYFLVSNADSISKMNGPFAAVAASVFGWGGAVFWGLDNQGNPNGIYGFEGGPGIGPEADIGFWMQYTWTYTFPTWVSTALAFVSGNPVASFLNGHGFGLDKRREALSQAHAIYELDKARYSCRMVTSLDATPISVTTTHLFTPSWAAFDMVVAFGMRILCLPR
jgi:RHS repeat-associated protein